MYEMIPFLSLWMWFRILLNMSLGTDRLTWKEVGGGEVMLWFFLSNICILDVKKKLSLQAKCKEKIFWCKIFTHKNNSMVEIIAQSTFQIKWSAPYSFSLLYFFTWVWIQWYFLWPLQNCCWGSLGGLCISCEVPSNASTTLGISDQCPLFCHHTGMLDHWISWLQTSHKSSHVEFKTFFKSWNTDTKAYW
jgi:hypothetical protein